MPWFITAICSKETVNRITENSRFRPNKSHTFGFYNYYNEAYQAVKENRCDMAECLYDYIIMEYMEPGIHPDVHVKEWWQWDTETKSWQYIPEREWPEEFIGLTNWALG
jgi:hypothetical protein